MFAQPVPLWSHKPTHTLVSPRWFQREYVAALPKRRTDAKTRLLSVAAVVTVHEN